LVVCVHDLPHRYYRRIHSSTDCYHAYAPTFGWIGSVPVRLQVTRIVRTVQLRTFPIRIFTAFCALPWITLVHAFCSSRYPHPGFSSARAPHARYAHPASARFTPSALYYLPLPYHVCAHNAPRAIRARGGGCRSTIYSIHARTLDHRFVVDGLDRSWFRQHLFAAHTRQTAKKALKKAPYLTALQLLQLLEWFCALHLPYRHGSLVLVLIFWIGSPRAARWFLRFHSALSSGCCSNYWFYHRRLHLPALRRLRWFLRFLRSSHFLQLPQHIILPNMLALRAVAARMRLFLYTPTCITPARCAHAAGTLSHLATCVIITAHCFCARVLQFSHHKHLHRPSFCLVAHTSAAFCARAPRTGCARAQRCAFPSSSHALWP